jgi:hypothetical protein
MRHVVETQDDGGVVYRVPGKPKIRTRYEVGQTAGTKKPSESGGVAKQPRPSSSKVKPAATDEPAGRESGERDDEQIF